MALEASFRVSYRIARSGQVHTIAENLIGPYAKDIAKCMLGEKAAKKIEVVPLSNNTVSRRINDLANYVENELLKRIKLNYFAIQLDESTDVTNAAVLLVYVRYLFTNIVQEDVIFANPLKTYTTGEAIFDMINGYFEKNGISWSYCVGVCTDGAKSMTGKFSGFGAWVKKINEKIQWTHCCINRQALVCKRIPAELSTTLSDAVKILNFDMPRQKRKNLRAMEMSRKRWRKNSDEVADCSGSENYIGGNIRLQKLSVVKKNEASNAEHFVCGFSTN
ncbi:zinc finger BED domain-containing protein 5-like [Stegodyphus dumicola]|uniref:zinc finger BED domain-containing protein 5-like n=1 Tax=Stegodyphus dumicola TaxID=202533 RepID=UPI0015ACB012|nr:zinc finger BED domain-containing protein 5-like [Stegodyphus dumicola]